MIRLRRVEAIHTFGNIGYMVQAFLMSFMENFFFFFFIYFCFVFFSFPRGFSTQYKWVLWGV